MMLRASASTLHGERCLFLCNKYAAISHDNQIDRFLLPGFALKSARKLMKLDLPSQHVIRSFFIFSCLTDQQINPCSLSTSKPISLHLHSNLFTFSSLSES